MSKKQKNPPRPVKGNNHNDFAKQPNKKIVGKPYYASFVKKSKKPPSS